MLEIYFAGFSKSSRWDVHAAEAAEEVREGEPEVALFLRDLHGRSVEQGGEVLFLKFGRRKLTTDVKLRLKK